MLASSSNRWCLQMFQFVVHCTLWNYLSVACLLDSSGTTTWFSSELALQARLRSCKSLYEKNEKSTWLTQKKRIRRKCRKKETTMLKIQIRIDSDWSRSDHVYREKNSKNENPENLITLCSEGGIQKLRIMPCLQKKNTAPRFLCNTKPEDKFKRTLKL